MLLMLVVLRSPGAVLPPPLFSFASLCAWRGERFRSPSSLRVGELMAELRREPEPKRAVDELRFDAVCKIKLQRFATMSDES